MCGSAFWMVSPSISNTSRNTPCAAGCCGPKFNVRLRISDTGSLPARGIQQCRVVAVVVPDHARHQDTRLDAHRFVHHALELRVVTHLDIADEREVLAKRMADEAVVGEDAAQIRMTAKQYPKQIKGLTLKPVGAGPDAGQRIDHRILDILAPDLHAQSLVEADRQQLRYHCEALVA